VVVTTNLFLGADSVASDQTSRFIKVLCAIFIPPVGVFLQVGLGVQFWINILLCLLFVLPGSIHALWIVLRD